MLGPTDVRVRAANAEDEPDVVGCVNAAYEHYVPVIGKKPAPMLADYAKLIRDGAVRVAVLDDAIVGVIVMWPEHDHLYVDNVAVLPEAQGCGVGAALLNVADVAARDCGTWWLGLRAWPGQAAPSLLALGIVRDVSHRLSPIWVPRSPL